MAIESIGQGSNNNIVKIYQMMERGDLILNPEFQRRLVWNADHKEYFLETILKGYPFPEVYFADRDIDEETVSCKTVVVDGQQRLSTIQQYIKGCLDVKYKRIKPYNELTDEEKKAFLYSTVVVRDLGNLSDDQLKEIFKRINSVSYALNAMEINNALYNGDFITTAKLIADKMTNCEFDFFKKGEYERMKDVEYVLTIMSTIELGAYFTNNKEVESFVKKYDDSYNNKNQMISSFEAVIKVICSLTFDWKSVWHSKSAMFSLLCELLKILHAGDKLPDNGIIQSVLDEIDERIRIESDKNVRFQNFYYYVCQGTGSKEGRTTRGNLIRDLLSKAI